MSLGTLYIFHTCNSLLSGYLGSLAGAAPVFVLVKLFLENQVKLFCFQR